jgi:hypothetical protein
MNKTTVMAILLASLFIAPSIFANCGNGNGNGNGNGCSGNGSGDGSVGPTGPQGPAGLNGTNGTNGTNGAQGVAGLNGTNGVNGVDATAQARLLGELDLRLWDTKHTSFYAFDSYHFNDQPGQDVFMDGRNAFYGFKFVVKLGKSYEETLLEKQDAKIKALEALVSKLSQ